MGRAVTDGRRTSEPRDAAVAESLDAGAVTALVGDIDDHLEPDAHGTIGDRR
ncbi:hypothetical protein [Natrinema soli]|uniref:Uncharacterized protein n=1 Tax=Natrinema soli TaxID=1930624 RepID=A0ABD5SLX3_9EURY|nr:hypothetical protein [Natrinema soli]